MSKIRNFSSIVFNKEWWSIPQNIILSIKILLPIIFAQLLQRLYPIIDNHYLSVLGNQALYIHNIQYIFIGFGQFVGMATAISCLTFWHRKECLQQQFNILMKHVFVVIFFMSIISIFSFLMLDQIIRAYKINEEYVHLAKIYINIGLINMVMQAVYISLDGILIASLQQRKSMAIAVFLVVGNIIADKFAVDYLFLGFQDVYGITIPILLMALSTSILLFAAIGISFKYILKQVSRSLSFSLKEMLRVWSSEIGIYLIRGVTPFIFTYQLCFINASMGFLVTYQLALQLSYVFCLPFLVAMQISIREASKNESNESEELHLSKIPSWWPSLLYLGILPSTLFLLLAIFFPAGTISAIYNYIPSIDHIEFLSIFFMACWIGQWGNVFTIPLRSRKLNYLVTKNFFLSEIIVMIGGTQLLITLNRATPLTIGFVTLAFSATYFLLNIYNCQSLQVTGRSLNETI